MRDHIVAMLRRSSNSDSAPSPVPVELEVLPAGDIPPLLYVIVALSVAVGITFGLIGTTLRAPAPVPPPEGIVLDRPAQDDFIITVAEAYALDRDVHLAQDRLARLGENSGRLRIEGLALDYAPQNDLIANRLAGLAVAFGSTDSTLLALAVQPEPPQIAALDVSAPVVPTEEAPAPQAAAPATSVPAAQDQLALQLPGRAQPEESAAAVEQPVKAAVQPSAVAQEESPDQPPTAVPPSRRTEAPTATPAPQPKPKATKPALARPSAPTIPLKNPLIARVPVDLPDYIGIASTAIGLTARPERCTPPNEIGAVVTRTVTLCAAQEYAPFKVQGENISVYGDKDGTAVVRGRPREFAISATGSNIAIVGVHVAAATDPADLNKWLCFFESCGNLGPDVHGGVLYGGGILLDSATDSSVAGSTVTGGTIGVAIRNGSSNKLIDNKMSDLNGWGTFIYFSSKNYIVRNEAKNINRPCTDPDGKSFGDGCESAAFAMIRTDETTFFQNRCEHSGNCYYANGMSGFGSNNNRFFNNYCAAATANCFEVTFSQGNRFDYNVATSDAATGKPCIYPFWIGGSVVKFGSHNTWSCKFNPDLAQKESRKSTDAETRIDGF